MSLHRNAASATAPLGWGCPPPVTVFSVNWNDAWTGRTMLNVGILELLLIAGVALMVVGPEQLPKLFRSAGRWYGQARRAADELRRAFVLEADRQDAAERYQQLQERRRQRATEDETNLPATVAQPDGDPEAPHLVAVEQGPEVEDAEELPDPNADAPDAPHPTRPVPPRADDEEAR